MRCRGAVLVTLVLVLLASSPARAFVAPGARIVSASDARQEQGDDDTSQVTLSGDGRYAAFTTRARNFFADDDPDPPGRFRFGGLFRRDLTTGALELVAAGDLRAEADPDTVLTRGAQNPSLSGDGRYVVFSTGYALVPADVNGNVDVYLRDMDKAIGAPGAYELISARDAGDMPAGYAAMPAELDRPGVNPGSDVTLGHALSADARYIAFRTSFIASDLPDAPAPTVGQLQVLVRDREAKRTSLLTRDATTGEPVGSANGGVSLSRDGSTVLWAGLGAGAQTRFLPGELVDPSSQYIFWRRWVDGPSTPTRRITGPSDPDDPGCSADFVFSLTATGPCYGPLATVEGVQGGLTGRLPVMSADGRRVAFMTAASPRGVVVGQGSDLFITDMSDGMSRKAGTVELTREGLVGPDGGAGIEGLDVSADGRWLAITTLRTTFTLPALTLTTRVRPQPTVRDLYLADLSARTIERIQSGFDGADANGSVGVQPSVSSDGRLIAFTSEASNLFFGDANGRADAFVVRREDAPPPEPPAADPEETPVTAAGEPAAPRPGRLDVRARVGKGGAVTLVVRAPAAGRLSAVARGRVPSASGRLTGVARRLASKTVRVRRGSRTLKLRIARTLRARLRAAGRIVGQADVRLVAADRRVWERRVTVAFRR